jgi:3-methyladenine DNA glycosylase AlkD
MKAIYIINELKLVSNINKKKILQRFFKTGLGEYGEGDIFLGVNVPKVREIINKYSEINLNEVSKLLQSKYHEVRLAGVLLLVKKYPQDKDNIFNFYLLHKSYINNWDLVDLSAYKIIGDYLLNTKKNILYNLAKSENLWDRRIAIISTFGFIRQGDYLDCLKISNILLKDDHDLIHKAVGWMLREIGKKDLKVEELFLKKYYKIMPRTMLRYAIEKFPDKKRKLYLKH